MKPRYRPLEEPEPPSTPPAADREPGPPPTPVAVARPPLPPPGSSRDRREERVRRFWAERERAERRRAAPKDGA